MIRQRVFEEIYQSMRNNINDRAPQVDSKPGTFVSDVFVCPPADELAAMYSDLKLMEFNQSILTAANDALDRLCANYFTFRIGATKAFGRVRFYITGTNRPTLELKNLPEEVYIPVGLVVGTTESATTSQVNFVTLESAYATGLQILNTLPVDVSTGYKYLEVEVEAATVGENGNVAAGGINRLVSAAVPGVAGLGNSAATTGGSDQENDTSLRMRTMLAVLGASICTKNGYLKFIIQKDYVEDAIVIGGGDSIMFRDGGFLDAAEQYRYGRGGMVDIWVRGKQVNEVVKNFEVTTAYLEAGAPDVVLDYQPVLRVTSITSTASGVVFENADDYDIEYGVSSTGTTYRYYKDVLWDFTVTDTFPDTTMYSVDVVDATELELLKRRVDEALVDAVEYMTNIDYTINWALVTYEDVSGYDQAPVFRKVYYNGKVYKVVAVDSRLNGRTFVKRNNRIYLRWYHDPDYVLLKDVYSDERYTSYVGADVGNSVLASDAVHWLNKNVLQEGDSLRIVYSYNLLTTTLQQQINGMRILTADILVRQAYAVKVQVIMTVYCDDSTTTTACRNTIATKISRFINNMKTMGDVLEESELAAIARQTYGVVQVDLESVQLAEKNKIAVTKIQLQANQYFELESVDVTAIAQYTLG